MIEIRRTVDFLRIFEVGRNLKMSPTDLHGRIQFWWIRRSVERDQVSILAKDMRFGQEMHQSEEPKALYDVTSPKDYAVKYSNEEMSHHTLYDVKCLYGYATTFIYTRDDVSDSALRCNICDRGNVGSQRKCNHNIAEGEINNLTMEQYLALTRGNQAPGVVKLEIGGNVNFEIKSQFMQELREDTFSRNKNNDAHEHVERIWVEILPLGTVNSWDLLKKAFIQRYCPPSKIAKQLEEIRNFKQEGDETLYQAWELYNDLLYRCPIHDINNHQKDAKTAEELILTRTCPLKEEVKSIEEAKYGKFERPSPFRNGAKYRVGPPGYYTRIDNRLPVGEKRPSLEELINKHLEESIRRRTEIEEWIKKLQENAEINTRNQAASLKNLEAQIEQLTKEFHTKAANEINNPFLDQYLGASVNVIPNSIFEHLKLTQLKKTDMLVEMADMTKRSPVGIVENVLVKIDKFLFPSDFVVMDMLNTRNETMILERPFIETIHAKIDVFNKEISLGIGGDKVTFDMDKKIHNFTTPIGEIYMINATSNGPSDASSRVEETNNVHNDYNQEQGRSQDEDPRERSFDDYKWMFDLEIDQLADEYELGIGKKGHMLEDIWENCRKVQGDNTYWWHDQKSEEEERRKLGINIEEYEPPMVHVETFKVKRYSFDTGQSFICVTKELMDALPMGRENGSRFRDMIRFLYEEIGIRSLLDSYSCGSKVLSWRNHLGENEIVVWILCKKSTLAIIT
ncbi:DNA-binding pseudobarrel domain-containing protein [Tanacetum coccineum]|uniref:DNA-binding pseudobarrel domain-containing protein n=1 Tax=Tanacetum coccineum TaxID=301880 RepID=A0ABQ5ER74_9ASTR